MDLDELRVLVSVVERGSLAAASKSLRFPIATMRRRLEQLEARMGVKLVERDRRGTKPTQAGLVLFEKARSLLSEVQSLADLVRGSGIEASGEVTVVVQNGVPPSFLAALFGLFKELTPKLTWIVRFADDPASTLDADVHLAVCIADRAPDGPWIAKKLFTAPEYLVASERYLERHGTPQTVEEVHQHQVITWTSPGRSGTELPLRDGTKVPFHPYLRVNDIWMVRQLAARDLGLALVPDGAVPDEFLTDGEDTLVHVLEDRIRGQVLYWLLASPANWRSPRLRLALDKLVQFVAAF